MRSLYFPVSPSGDLTTVVVVVVVVVVIVVVVVVVDPSEYII